MRCVVVGGLGMIGRAVTRELLARGRDVLVLDLEEPEGPLPGRAEYRRSDVRCLGGLIDDFRGVDQAYHFAGELGTADMDDAIRQAVETNVGGTLNVLDAALVNGVPVVFNPCKPNVWLNTYTITKRTTEDFCRLYNKAHGGRLKVVQLRYFNAYGPDQHLHPVRKIVPAFMLQAMCGLPVEVYGSGEQTVDLIHVDDLARVTVEVTDRGFTEDVPDCGSGDERTVNQVAEAVNAVFGNRRGVRHLPMRRGEDDHTRLAANRMLLTTVVGAKARTRPLAEGLRQTADWMRSLPRAKIDRALAFYGWRA